MTNDIIAQDDDTFAHKIAKSSMCPPAFKNKPSEIAIAVGWGKQIGLNPFQSLQNIAVVNGRPSLYGDSLLAVIQQHPEYAGHDITIEGEGDKLRASCTMRRQTKHGPMSVTETFSIGDAQRAGLWGKSGPWKQYPKRMLKARARAFAIREAFADALNGFSLQEEAADIPSQAPRSMQDVTPPNMSDNPLDRAFGQIEAPTVDAAEKMDEDTGEILEPDPAAAEPLPMYMLGDDSDPVMCDTIDAWSSMFTGTLNTLAKDPSIEDAEVRRHNCGEFKKANDEILEQIKSVDADMHKSLADAYRKHLRTLSAQAKEAKGND